MTIRLAPGRETLTYGTYPPHPLLSHIIKLTKVPKLKHAVRGIWGLGLPYLLARQDKSIVQYNVRGTLAVLVPAMSKSRLFCAVAAAAAVAVAHFPLFGSPHPNRVAFGLQKRSGP